MSGDMTEADLFNRGPVVVFRWRNAVGWPVEFVSANVAETFGYTAEEFLDGAVSYAELIHEDDIDRVAAEVQTAIESTAESFEHAPYRTTHRDGSVRWLYDTTHLLRSEGVVTHFLGYVIDITARIRAQEDARALERRLLQAQRLESLGMLAGGIAHDFNNILTGILGEATISHRAITAGTDVGPGIERIEHLALRAADLTRQLLAYSGKGRFVVIPLDLTHVVDDMAKMLAVVVSKKAKLDLRLDHELPAMSGDRAQLQQIVMNLISNASDSLGDCAGVITLATGVRDLDAATLAEAEGTPRLEPGRYVALSVTDTGCGMTDDVREHLFEPFFTTKASGRGLGMSAILGIVRSHEGAISVRSSPGEGSSFELLFPACDAVAAPAVAAGPTTGWRGKGLALVVDDEPSVLRVAASMLGILGFETVTAQDGTMALEVYRDRKDEITLVVLDMMMPKMNGEETLRKLRSLTPALPVVISSGFDESEVTTQLTRDTHTTFLQKPYLLEDVVAAVREVFETDP
ncbi:MAG: hypothetical protein DRJ42_03365 [Deltaproteobacteria bacterium]|nr:MAG: hypothetical protein DRJ42_03365 [Deltaproteobacteria bacterium]